MPTPHAHVETFVVPDGEGGRLDHFLVRRLPGCSRRLARLAIGAGAVRVNGRPAHKGQALQPGDVVRAERAAFHGSLAGQPDLAVPVLYADPALVALDKPAGMPTVALNAGDRDTVANYLVGCYPDLAGIGRSALEAGIAHRLDTATSGVLVAGRTSAAWHHLRRQFRDQRVDKLYLAVVAGDVAGRGTITAPIAHQRRRMSVCPDGTTARRPGTRPAVTRYRPLGRFSATTLLAVQIATGVRHQIRVHLASIGHPVLGDPVYGDAATAPRLLLHAARLGFAHPLDGRRMILRCPLPADFLAAIRW